MAEPTSTTSEAPEATKSSGKAHSPIFTRLAVLAFLVVVIVVECLAASMYLPSAGDAEAVATAASTLKEPPKEEVASKPAEDVEHGEQIEVDLEEFSVTAFQPATSTSLRIDFHLYGTVLKEEEKEIKELLEKNVHRFRDQVIVIVRGAELSDLTDAGLGLIKRRILEKTNRILGKPLLKAVIVSDFSFIEQ
jgi:flagellar FliL protein